MARTFSREQRRKAHLRQGGRCAICRDRSLSFEGDHIHPWSEEGETEDGNLALLCTACHKKKTALDKSLRTWQRDCAQLVVDQFHRKKDALIVADTGGGKTRAAIVALLRLIPFLNDPLFVIVVPGIPISGGWERELDGLRMSFEIGRAAGDGLPADCAALIVTYAGLERMENPIKGAMRQGRDIVVVFDEIHHCKDDGEEDESDWATVAARVFPNPKFRLFLTGTPFRTHGRIPWLEPTFDRKGRETYKATYELKRTVAIANRWTRAVQFTMLSHKGILIRIAQETRLQWEAVMDGQGPKDDEDRILSRALRQDAYLLPFLEWFLRQLEAKRRIWRREGGPEKGAPLGMIVCHDHAHQKQVAKLLAGLGKEGIIVHSNVDGSHTAIDNFRDRIGKEGRSEILLSCQMVSEGCDIPALAVGAILTWRRTDLVIDQMVGRFRRVTKFERDTFAYSDFRASLIVPAHHAFISYAKRMLDLEVDIKEPGPGGPPPPESTVSWGFESGETEFSSVHSDGEYILDPRVRRMMDRLKVANLLTDAEDPAVAMALHEALSDGEDLAQRRNGKGNPSAASPNEERKILRGRCEKIARFIIGSTGRPGGEVWVEAKQRAGIHPGRPVDVLERDQLQVLVTAFAAMREELE